MPRLPQGMYRRGSAFYMRTWEGGRDRRRSLGSNYSKALDAYHKLKAGLEAEPTKAVTVSEMGERWCDTYVPTRRRGKGPEEARSRFRRLLGRFLGHMAPDRVTPDHLRQYRTWLEGLKATKTGKGYRPSTVKHFLDDAKSFCDWLEEGGHIDRSPFPKKIMPRQDDPEPDPYSDEELKTLLALEDPYGWTIRLGLECWARWGEVTRLQARDVQRDGTITYVQNKTGKSKSVPLPPDLAAEIRHRVGLLVPFSPTSSGSFNREVTKRAGFKFTFHRLRDTAACRALDNGVRIETVSALLGHKSIESTRHYARLSDKAVRREVEEARERARL